ncbi:hypothetical protein HPB50_008278 [Hyalomma asiaticum]|uniref:Uncharacterized protein n=1 Tax=Hyalomma asiaticum TaxID=266040 RepID=A0ACB7SM84_HYAAI|nr:hypothetical protein HPB50_008278 [Hyalomma asiaticum]
MCEKKGNVNVGDSQPISSSENTARVKFVRVLVNGQEELFKVDTGAAVTIVSQEFPGVSKKLRKSDQVVTRPGNTGMDPAGNPAVERKTTV